MAFTTTRNHNFLDAYSPSTPDKQEKETEKEKEPITRAHNVVSDGWALLLVPDTQLYLLIWRSVGLWGRCVGTSRNNSFGLWAFIYCITARAKPLPSLMLNRARYSSYLERQADERIDRQTNSWIDKASYRVASPRLNRKTKKQQQQQKALINFSVLLQNWRKENNQPLLVAF